MYITVKQAGSLTSIQDDGRYRHQGEGIPVCGALDPLAMKTANILVGNPEDHPVLECIGSGPVLELSDGVCFAVCGGSFDVYLNDEPAAMYQVHRARAGDRLRIGYSSVQRSCCIAFSADYALEPVAGSYSTDFKGKTGGYEGRKLKSGDLLELIHVRSQLPYMEKRRTAGEPVPEDVVTLRVIEGPNEDRFTAEGIRTFYSSIHTVSAKSDRMGYRLEGPVIETVSGNDILSGGIVTGAIQVTPQQAIMMMADHATTGGYAVIATVIGADLGKAAQCMPGVKVRFVRTTVEEAQEAWKAQMRELQDLKASLKARGLVRLIYKWRERL
ncbi:MAG: biotin-dependent carboxyltransferase family protein [Solobacterium sp.]|nr:biotin-dependent carboxyltransferase family protein [Solobacterium sp.]